MKIFFYQHFWSDSPPYAKLLGSLGVELTQNEHEMSVITQQLSYNQVDRFSKSDSRDKIDGAEITRISLLFWASKHRFFYFLIK